MQVCVPIHQFTTNNDIIQIERPETSKYSSMSRRHTLTKNQMRNTSINWLKQTQQQQSPSLKRNGTLEKRNSSNFINMKEKLKDNNFHGFKIDNFKVGITLEEYILTNLELQPIQSKEEEVIQINQDIGIFRKNFMIDEKQQYQWQTKQTPSTNMRHIERVCNSQSKDKIKVIKHENFEQNKNFNIRNINNGWKQNERLKQKSLKKEDNISKQQRMKVNKKLTTTDFYKNIQQKINFAEFECSEEYLLKKYGNKFNLNKDFNIYDDPKKIERITIGKNNNQQMKYKSKNK